MDSAEIFITAIEYEEKVRDLYLSGVDIIDDKRGKALFQGLADDEQSHVDFLKYSLDILKRDGEIEVDKLTTPIPSQEEILSNIETMKAKIPEKKISFIPMAVDTDEFSDFREREQAGLFKEGKASVRLLFVGNASIEKGLEVLIDALGLLKKKGIDFQLIAALENQSRLCEFESRREMIEHRVEELGLEDHVNITGVVKRIGAYLKETQILVVPFQDVPGLRRVSDYPMVLLEGMACGKCVVATPLRGVSEILTNGVNGILSESFTSESLSKAMLQGILNSDLRRSSGIEAGSSIKQKYSTEIVASQLLDLYRRLLSVQSR